MKIFLYISFLFLNTITFSIAQVKMVSPLPCDTWGEDKYLNYDEIKTQYKNTEKKGVIDERSEERYNGAYQKNKEVISYIPLENIPINNIQIIRWQKQRVDISYQFSIMNLEDEILYKISTNKSCGLILFPDSILAKDQYGHLFMEIQPVGPEYDLRMRHFDRIVLSSLNNEVRRTILNELQACASLECKIKILQSYGKTLDILSLLEIEKMKDPQNTNIDTLYWNFVSGLRYELCRMPEYH